MVSTPHITVLMSVYNPPIDMLQQAVDSILAQSFSDFEFLILDDGSSDEGALAHLEGRALRDARVRLIREPHRGLTATLNRGLELARGTFIARQDADDWSAPRRLELQAAYFREHPHDAVCGTNAWTHQHDGRRLWRTHLPLSHGALLDALPRGNPFVHGSVLFRRDAALAAGGYRTIFRCSQDYDFFWRLAERHGAANLEEPLYHYRYTSGSISARKAAEQLRSHEAIRALAETRLRGEPEDVTAAFHRAGQVTATGSGAFRAQLKQADHRMLAGDYRGAAQAYLDLLLAQPRNLLAWGKFARLGLFRAAPFLREVCFR